MGTRILLAGCGELGATLGSLLAREGHEVWGLRRNTALLPEEMRGWSADLCDPDSLSSPPVEFSHVVYTATPGVYEEEAYQRTYVEGVRNLLATLRKQRNPPRRFVLSSSTSVYHHHGGEWVDEDTPTTPAHFSGRANLEGERITLASGVPSVVVRFGGIYGPGRTRLVEQVAAGRARCVENSVTFSNRIHSDDCVGILRHLLFHPAPPTLVNAVDQTPATLCEVYGAVARLLQVAPPPTVSPEEAGRRARNSKRVQNRRLVESGYVFRYPTYREGYREVVEGWKQGGGRWGEARDA